MDVALRVLTFGSLGLLVAIRLWHFLERKQLQQDYKTVIGLLGSVYLTNGEDEAEIRPCGIRIVYFIPLLMTAGALAVTIRLLLGEAFDPSLIQYLINNTLILYLILYWLILVPHVFINREEVVVKGLFGTQRFTLEDGFKVGVASTQGVWLRPTITIARRRNKGVIALARLFRSQSEKDFSVLVKADAPRPDPRHFKGQGASTDASQIVAQIVKFMKESPTEQSAP